MDISIDSVVLEILSYRQKNFTTLYFKIYFIFNLFKQFHYIMIIFLQVFLYEGQGKRGQPDHGDTPEQDGILY